MQHDPQRPQFIDAQLNEMVTATKRRQLQNGVTDRSVLALGTNLRVAYQQFVQLLKWQGLHTGRGSLVLREAHRNSLFNTLA